MTKQIPTNVWQRVQEEEEPKQTWSHMAQQLWVAEP
jgi:hypothetical protein